MTPPPEDKAMERQELPCISNARLERLRYAVARADVDYLKSREKKPPTVDNEDLRALLTASAALQSRIEALESEASCVADEIEKIVKQLCDSSRFQSDDYDMAAQTLGQAGDRLRAALNQEQESGNG